MSTDSKAAAGGSTWADDDFYADSVITVTRQAREVIEAMQAHVAELGRWFGPNSTEHRVAAASLARAMGDLFRYRTLRVMWDSRLSLVCTTPGGYTFGLLFHGNERRCTSAGCRARVGDTGVVWTFRQDDYVCLDGQHSLSWPLDCPTPGSWSYHS